MYADTALLPDLAAAFVRTGAEAQSPPQRTECISRLHTSRRPEGGATGPWRGAGDGTGTGFAATASGGKSVGVWGEGATLHGSSFPTFDM